MFKPINALECQTVFSVHPLKFPLRIKICKAKRLQFHKKLAKLTWRHVIVRSKYLWVQVVRWVRSNISLVSLITESIVLGMNGNSSRRSMDNGRGVLALLKRSQSACLCRLLEIRKSFEKACTSAANHICLFTFLRGEL